MSGNTTEQTALFSQVSAEGLCEVRLTDIEPWEKSGNRVNTTQSSVSVLGFFDPVTLVKLHNQPYKYRVKDGRRRLDALLAAGKSVTWAVVLETDEVTAAGVGLAANLARSNNLVSEAHDLERLLTSGMSLSEVSKRFRIPLGTLKRRAAFIDAPAEVKAALVDDTLVASVAEDILKLPKKQQAPLLKRLRGGEKLDKADVKQSRLAVKEQALADLDGFFEIKPPDAKLRFRAAVVDALGHGLSATVLKNIIQEVRNGT
jgi:ParB/RepB/Spo0J family partition protein